MKQYLEKFKSLSAGQKIKIFAVIIVIIIILYMLSGFFGGSSSNSYSAAVTSSNNNTAAMPIQKPLVAVVTPKAAIKNPEVVMNNLNNKQVAYLTAVNELQMLQLKQQIAQTKQQIAQAELQAAQSNKQLQDLTAPPPPPPVFNSIAQQPLMTEPQTPAPTTASIPVNSYQLEYIANEGGKWQVIINNNGTLINATMGTTLPDGSIISNISGTSVTLALNGQTRLLTIAPSY